MKKSLKRYIVSEQGCLGKCGQTLNKTPSQYIYQGILGGSEVAITKVYQKNKIFVSGVVNLHLETFQDKKLPPMD